MKIFFVFFLWFDGQNYYSDIIAKCSYSKAIEAVNFFSNKHPDYIDGFISPVTVSSTAWSDACGTTVEFEMKNWLQYTDDNGKFHMVKIPRN